MLRFPLHNVTKTKGNRRLPLEDDDKHREQQNKDFVEMYGGNPKVCHKRIDNRDDLFVCINDHLHHDCSSTCLATIVFNGHGSEVDKALCVHSGGNVKLIDIIHCVHLSMHPIRHGIGAIQMPRAVDIVFAQCFGHMHGYRENPQNVINVIPLTSNEHPVTFQFVKSTEQCPHFDMQQFAQEREQRQAQAAEITQENTTTSLQGATGGQV